MSQPPQSGVRGAVESYYDRRWRQRQLLNVPAILRQRRVLSYLRRYRPELAGRAPRIVELGCGQGRLAARLSSEGRVTAVDLSRATLAVNRERYPQVDFRWGDLTDPALAKELGTFDVVVTSEVAEHIELGSRPAFFANLAAMVESGGLLLLTTPDRGVLERAGRPVGDDQPVNNLFDSQELLHSLDRDFTLLERSNVHPLVSNRGFDLAWKILFLPFGYRGVDALTTLLGLPGTYQVLALRRRQGTA